MFNNKKSGIHTEIRTPVAGMKTRCPDLTRRCGHMVGIAGFEPATLRSQSECTSQTALYPDTKMEPPVGIEPTTSSLQVRCSTS